MLQAAQKQYLVSRANEPVAKLLDWHRMAWDIFVAIEK